MGSIVADARPASPPVEVPIGNMAEGECSEAPDVVVIDPVVDDELSLAIVARSTTIATLGEYWGFAEWLAWGWMEQRRIIMYLNENPVNIFEVFRDAPTVTLAASWPRCIYPAA